MALSVCGLNTNETQKELKPHGTPDFPCAAYASSHTSCPGDAISWHWHEELEIIFVESGSLLLRVPGSDYRVSAGELAFLNSNVLHYGIGAPACSIHSLVFSPVLLSGHSGSAFQEKYLKPLIGFSGFLVWKSQKEEDISAFCAAFSAMERDSFAYEFTVREQLSHIFLSCFRELRPQFGAPQAGRSMDSLRMEKMLEFIQTHYPESITTAEIADAAGLSQRECLRCFQRVMRESPIQYLLKYRLMQSAGKLRARPDASIAEISAQCGFDYPSYYSAQFRRFYLCSPREYRKNP